MARTRRKKKEEATRDEEKIFGPLGSNRETIQAALDEWTFLPFDCLAYHDERTVVLMNGLESLYVALSAPTTPAQVGKAQEHYFAAGGLVRAL